MIKRSNKDAFLMFEFVFALGLIVVFTSCILFSASWLSKFVVQTELKAIQSFFLYMQQKAIIHQQDIKVVFDTEKNQCREVGQSGSELLVLHKDIRFGALAHVQGPPSSPSHAIIKPITFAGNAIIFYKTGVLSSGVMYLLDAQNNGQYALSNAVSSVSFIRLYQYVAGKWTVIE